MSNMSYCRHENTASDLYDVIEQWDDFNPEDSSWQEVMARARIIEYALQLVNDYGLTQEDADELVEIGKKIREEERNY